MNKYKEDMERIVIRHAPYIIKMKIIDEMKEYISQLKIIDVHEHLIADEVRIHKFRDYMSLVFSNYTGTSAVSAGVPEKVIDIIQGEGELEEKYPLFISACQKIQNTVSFQCLDIAFRKIYGMSILDENYIELNSRYCEKNKKDFTYGILKQMHVEKAINDVFDFSMQNTNYGMDYRVFESAVRCDKFIMIHEYLTDVEKEFQREIDSLDELCLLIDEYIHMHKTKLHAVAIKIAVAYYRTLHFEAVEKIEAERIFQELSYRIRNGQKMSMKEAKPLSDYMMHFLAATAEKNSLPIQIHTGVQDRNINNLRNSYPMLLNPLFEKYSGVTFNLFHTGFPYGLETGVLAKMFPNVFVDFSWVHILSPTYAVKLMQEYLELIPAVKISGFGGDFCNAEGAFGHWQIAGENIAQAIANMIEEGWYSLDYGKQLVKQILYDNPKAIYHL